MDGAEMARLILQTIGLAVSVGGAIYAAIIRPLAGEVRALRDKVHALEVAEAAETARDEATRALLVEIRDELRNMKAYVKRTAKGVVREHERACRSYAGGTSRRTRSVSPDPDREEIDD